MPKGVVWRQEDAFFACIGGGDPTRAWPARSISPAEVLDRIIDALGRVPPGGAAHARRRASGRRCRGCYAGGTVVLLPGSLDPVEVWRTVERERVNLMTVVGDAVVRPLVDAWERERAVRRVVAVLDRHRAAPRCRRR